MKSLLASFSLLSLLAAATPVAAHPGHEHPAPAYLAFWMGVLPKSASVPAAQPNPASPAFWKQAFVSKFPILGSQLPPLQP
jgi:hypothetical protein